MLLPRINSIILIFFCSLLLISCSDPLDGQIAQQLPLTEQRINALGLAIDNGQVRNANLITQYASYVNQLKPQLNNLVSEFKKDGTSQGTMYLSLVDRLATAKNQPQMFASKTDLYEELINLYQAADPILFSDALSDPLNVLADMSDGQLPRVNALPKEQSLQANHAQDFGVGEQLIGNPSYGQWQTGSNGLSFWEWYGMYAMFDNLVGRRTYYHDWGSGRNYSYYNDYGRTRYSSPDQLRQQTTVDNRTRKSFEQRGKRFTSAYAQNKVGGSSLSSKSQTAQNSANKFRSTTVNKSSYASKTSSGSNASFRDSRSMTSRSPSRGK